ARRGAGGRGESGTAEQHGESRRGGFPCGTLCTGARRQALGSRRGRVRGDHGHGVEADGTVPNTTGAGRRMGTRPPLALRAAGRRRQRWMSASSSLSLASYSRPWWPQNNNSPPFGRTARIFAAAPQRSQRSAAVSSGRVSVVGVIGVSLRPGIASRCHRSAATTVVCVPADRGGSLPPLLQTFWLSQVFPSRVGAVSRRISPNVADSSTIPFPAFEKPASTP